MTNEKLAKAAEEANRILVENLPNESECKHIFSQKFDCTSINLTDYIKHL